MKKYISAVFFLALTTGIGLQSFAHAEVYQVAHSAALILRNSTPTDFFFFADNKGIARFYCSGWNNRSLTLNVSLGSSTIESPGNRFFYKELASSNECKAALNLTASVAYQTPAKVKIDLQLRDSTFEVILQE